MNVLIVDDEKQIRDLMGAYLKLEGIASEGAENGLSAQRLLKENHYDACLVDLKMPGMDGLTLLGWIRDEGYRMPVIMVSAHGEIRDAVEALTGGAQDFIVKPFDPEELSLRLVKLIEAQNLRNRIDSGELVRHQIDGDDLIGESRSMLRIKEIISRIAATPATVMITGESGTGKEVVARRIHSTSLLSEGPFVAVNIGGVAQTLLESELFGYEKGAFTGAESRKVGMFELASGGTLFLDEIGEMPPELQVKLLRVLQEKKITRLGGTSSIPINARIISATNRDVEEMVREGRFREDLFYRLNVVRIELPALRERREDIPLLAGTILSRLNRLMNRRVEGIAPDALDYLKRYSFPGNVRELENILERAVIFSEQPLLQKQDLELRGIVLREGRSASAVQETETGEERTRYEPKTISELEREAVIRALHRWEGNRTRAAEELGISRRTLINKIAEFNLDL
jgi:two-component system, NtrC family, response regulator AtoC